jgi:transcriptional regulator with XRE-family HTH domain
VRLERETFGPVLRAARERQGLTLKQLARETKLSSELWEGLEDNDLSRWPKRVFARSYVRDYALRVGLDADEVVNEFCRLFPEWGDRRSERVMREKAEIIAHDLTWEDLPAPPDRRASDRATNAAPGFVRRHRVRLIAVSIDMAAILSVGASAKFVGFGFWPSVAVASASYTGLSTILVGRSFGLVTSEWLARTLKSMPASRRPLSSRAENA